jgi:hypothetical protein
MLDRDREDLLQLERVRQDRLLRWSLYAAVPCAWLALALVNPLLLLLPFVFAGCLWTVMHYGIVERFEPEDEPDFF